MGHYGCVSRALDEAYMHCVRLNLGILQIITVFALKKLFNRSIGILLRHILCSENLEKWSIELLYLVELFTLNKKRHTSLFAYF